MAYQNLGMYGSEDTISISLRTWNANRQTEICHSTMLETQHSSTDYLPYMITTLSRQERKLQKYNSNVEKDFESKRRKYLPILLAGMSIKKEQYWILYGTANLHIKHRKTLCNISIWRNQKQQKTPFMNTPPKTGKCRDSYSVCRNNERNIPKGRYQNT